VSVRTYFLLVAGAAAAAAAAAAEKGFGNWEEAPKKVEIAVVAVVALEFLVEVVTSS